MRNDNRLQLSLKVITNSKQEKVVELGENSFKVYTSVAPEKGKANDKVLELLAEHLGAKRSELVIVRGATTNHKIIEWKKN